MVKISTTKKTKIDLKLSKFNTIGNFKRQKKEDKNPSGNGHSIFF